jgi:hypothetical protein
MCCGAPATNAPQHTFSWMKPGLEVLIHHLGPVVLLFRNRVVARTPLCPRHCNYWRWRGRVFWGGLLLFLVGALVGVLLADKLAEAGEFGWPLASALLFGLGWVCTTTVLWYRGLRAYEDGPGHIMLENVSQLFANACRRDFSERP